MNDNKKNKTAKPNRSMLKPGGRRGKVTCQKGLARKWRKVFTFHRSATTRVHDIKLLFEASNHSRSLALDVSAKQRLTTGLGPLFAVPPTATHWRPTLEPRVQHVCSACAPRVHHVCICIFTHILNLRSEEKICYYLII